MDPIQIIQALESDNKPTDDQLSDALKGLREALDIATSSERPDLDTARDIREAIDTVNAEVESREAALAEARAEAAKLREGILDDKAEDAPEPEADEVDGAEVVAEAEKITAEAKEPVAASISLIERLKRRAQSLADEEAPEVIKSAPGTELRSIGPAAGFDLDNDAGFSQLGAMFSTHARGLNAKGTNQPLARLTRHFDEDRTLGNNVELNNRRIADLFGPDQAAVTAAGGFCGPGDVDHSHPICADTGRPVRDSLVQFNASRGRVTFAPSAGLGDVAGAVSIWTNETDVDPGDSVKPCPPVECPEELSCAVDAVTRCLTIGNFQAQFSPEFWASRLQLLTALHDRTAEQKAISEIHAASTLLTAVNEGNVLGSFLSAINRVIAADRSIQRNTSGRYRVLADAWVRDAIRNQVIANLGVANNVDAIQVADAQISGWLTQLNADVTWTYDGTINDDSGEHNLLDDPNAFLASSTVYVYPADAFMFLDGGTLDLGTSITDSSLNATNDRQAFAETFEKVCFRGCSAYAVPIDVSTACGCPGGEG